MTDLAKTTGKPQVQPAPWPIIPMRPANRQAIRIYSMLHVKNPACPDTPHSARLTGCGCMFTRDKAVAAEYAARMAQQ